MIKYCTVAKICDLSRKNSFNDCDFIDKSDVKYDDTVYSLLKGLVKKYDIKTAVLEHDEDMKPQLSFVKFTGSNGKECSIKSSLLEMYCLLNDLESESCVDWCQILDISIDNADDTYAFLVTLILK